LQIGSEIVWNVTIDNHQMLEISFLPLSFILRLKFGNGSKGYLLIDHHLPN